MGAVLAELRWPSLARDLAIMSAPDSPLASMDAIYATYNVSDTELAQILTIPKFQKLLKEALADMQALGSNAGAMYRASSLAQALSEQLFREASSGQMKAAEAIKLLELFLKAGGLLNTDKPNQTVNVQNNIGVSLPLPKGLKNKKLRHIEMAAEGAL